MEMKNERINIPQKKEKKKKEEENWANQRKL